MGRRASSVCSPLALWTVAWGLSVGCTGGGDAEFLAQAGGAVQTYVGSDLVFDASGSVGASTYAWTFGDGQSSVPSTEAQATHRYEAPGHFSAVLQVRDAQGRTAASTRRVTAIYRPLERPPQASSLLAEAADGSRLFVALPDFDRVAVIALADGSVETHLEGCAAPSAVAQARSVPVLAAACRGTGKVQLFDSETLEAGAEIELGAGAQPTAVLLDAAAERLWVVDSAGAQVAAYELAAASASGAAPTLLWEASPGPDLRGMSWVEDRLVLTQWRSPADGGRYWFGPDDGSTFTEGRLALDPGPDSDTTSRGVPSYLEAIAIRPDGKQWVFPSTQANVERGPVRDGEALSHETTVRAVLSQVLWSPEAPTDAPVEDRRKTFDDRGLARAATYGPEGAWLYVAMMGMETVEFLDPFTLQGAGSILSVGRGVDGLWVEPSGAGLWVLASLSRELVRYALDGSGGLPRETHRLDLRPAGEEVLDAEVLLGKQVFHRASDLRMSRDGYLSCASCHLEGRGDNRTWDFTDRGEGLRNTASLRGFGALPDGPIHWSGNFDEVQDFEGDVRFAFAGTGFLSEAEWAETSETLGPPKAGLSEELDALAAYLATLDEIPSSPYRGGEGELSEEAVQGEALFLSDAVGCALCHPPPHYTDSQWLAPGEPMLHDVGTITAESGGRLGGELLGLDTPSLRGLWDSKPYLHDGSAVSLDEVLVKRNPDDLHGTTSQLTEAERLALVAFLLQIP